MKSFKTLYYDKKMCIKILIYALMKNVLFLTCIVFIEHVSNYKVIH